MIDKDDLEETKEGATVIHVYDYSIYLAPLREPTSHTV
jgi:hypothetical protein